MNIFKTNLLLPASLALCLLACTLAGCSGPGTTNNTPPGTTNPPSCKAGEKVENGACVAISCDASHPTACEDGTTCNKDGKCEIVKKCDEASDCRSRLCQKGACVNPSSCLSLAQCTIGYVCDADSKKCKRSACSSGCVGDGVCDESSGQCVSKAECHDDGDCAGRERCIGATGSAPGTCMSHDDFAAQGCNGRGVVDDVEFACKDKATCSGDGDCLPGKVCSPDGACVIDKCKAGACTAGGVCNNLTGECENKPACTLNSECLSGYSCIIKGGVGECRKGFDANADAATKERWCQQAGMACTGKRKCNVAGTSAFTLTCAEDGEKLCDSTKDCDSSTERCQFNTTDNKNKCSAAAAPSSACSYTSYDNATQITAAEKQLCGTAAADADHFVIPLQAGAGEVYVTATLDTLDVGAGELKLTLLSNDGTATEPARVLATKTQDAGTSSVTLSLPISANNNAASVVLKVEAANARVGGLKYTLVAGFTSAVGSDRTCSMVHELPIGEVVEGDNSIVSTGALTDCNDKKGEIQEEVWHFHLDSLSEVEVVASPLAGSALWPVLSIRKESCYASGTVACQDATTAATLSMDKQILDPGDYYIVVSGKNETKNSGGVDEIIPHLGKYALRVNAKAVECRTGETKCDATSQYVLKCKADRTWQSNTDGRDCGAAGECLKVQGEGLCKNDKGMSCAYPKIVVFQSDVFKDTLDLSTREESGSETSVYGSACGGSIDWDQKEFVYQVTIPKGKKIKVEVNKTTSPESTDGTIVVLDSCVDRSKFSEHCIVGKDGAYTDEHLDYDNTTGTDQTVFVYYDFKSYDDYTTINYKQSLNLKITLEDGSGATVSAPECEPVNSFKCDFSSGGISQCLVNSSYKKEYQGVFTCTKGCKKGVLNAECNPPNGDKCNEAVDVNNATDYGTKYYYVHEAHDYTETPAGCGTIGADRVGGKEFVFVYTADSQKVREVEVSVKHSGFTPLIWVSDQPCNSSELSKVGACTTGVDKKDSSPGDDTTPQEDTFTFTAQKGKKYYIVVEPSRGDASELLSGKGRANFQIKVNAVDKEECTPNTIVGCSDDNAKVKYCNAFGVVEEHACANSLTCNATDGATCGVKSDPNRKGDTCFDAIYTDLTATSAQQSGQLKGTFDGTFATTSAFNPKGELGQCLFTHNPENVLQGKDRVYQFLIPAESTLFATLNISSTSGSVNDSIRRHVRAYFLENCLDENSCIGSRERGSTELYYKNEDAAAKTVYLVLDTDNHTSLNGINWTIDWESKKNSEKECVPGKSHCLADGTVGVCTKEGKVSRVTEEHVTCVGGAACLAGGCLVPQNQGKLCSNAIDLDGAKKSNGTLDYYATINLKEDGQKVEPECGKLVGSAVYYRVEADKGQWIDVDARTTTDRPTGVFVLKEDDCSEDNACLASDSKDSQQLESASLSYYVEEKGVYVIVITTSERNSRYEDADTFAHIALRNAECQLSDPTVCSSETGKGNVVVYCGHTGKLVEYTCASGTCAEGSCASGNGDSCPEAIQLEDSSTKSLETGTITGKLLKDKHANAIIDLEPSQGARVRAQKSGLCSFYKGHEYKDAYYYTDLKKGDQLDVTVTLKATRSFFAYLIKDCGEEMCLEDDYGQISTSGSERVRAIHYIAPEDGRYRLVIKSADTQIDAESMTVTWKITRKSTTSACQSVYGAVCTSDSELSMCMETAGSTTGYLAEGRCVAGTICKKNLCLFEDKAKLETVSACDENTPVITASGKYLIPMDQLPDTGIEALTKGNDSVRTALDYRVAYFKVSLQPHQVFKVHARLPSSDAYKAIMFKDCEHINDTLEKLFTNVYNEGETTRYVDLLDGPYRAGDKPEEFYVALFVTGEQSGPVRTFFEVIDPQCNPAEFKPKCKTDGGSVILVCNAEGLYEEHTCSNGGTCSGAEGSAVCSSLDGDTCAEAIVPTFSSNSFTSTGTSFAGKNNSYGKGVTCTHSTLEGRDVVYRVELTAGQTLDAKLTGAKGHDGSSDLAIYLTKSCAALPKACLVGSDSAGVILEDNWDNALDTDKSESLSYTAKGTETVFVIVDSYFENLSSNYTLELTRTGP